MEGSTQEAGDRVLNTTQEVADVLTERRQARAEAPPVDDAPAAEDVETDTAEALEDITNEALETDPDTEEGDAPALDDDDQEVDDQPDAADDDDRGSDDKFEYVDELAEAAGMELDDFMAIKAKTLVDGETSEVTLGELIKGHQLESSFTRKNQAWVEQKRATETQFEAQREKLTDHFKITTDVFQHAQQALVADFESINWSELQASDPGEYQRLRQQLGERQGRLNHAIKQSTDRVKQAREAQKADEAAAEEATLNQEREMLMAKVPEWRDETKRKAEAAEVGEFLLTVGFDESEVSTMKDHRLILLARKALGLAGPSKKQLELAKKKVNKVPKLVKPGSQKPRNSGDTKRIQSLKSKAKKTGRVDDVAELLIARRAQRAKGNSRSPR